MANIKVRGRIDALVVEDALAKQIKERKFGVEGRVQKASSTDLLEIVHSSGSWSGEYGRITEIDISRGTEVNNRREEERRKENERDERWLRLPAAEKAKASTTFEMSYCTRVFGKIKCEVPEEAQEAAYKIRVAYFEKNTRSFNCPASAYPETIMPRSGKNIRSVVSDRMNVSNLSDEIVAYPES